MRIRFLALLLVAAALAPVYAQDGLSAVEYSDYEKGDGIFSLNLGTNIPLGFYDPTQPGLVGPNSTLGFAFGLSYLGFLDEHWALGGDAGGAFITTLAERRLFLAPISFKAAYAINLSPISILPTIGVGMAISSLSDYKHIDPLFKLGSSFLWRYNSDVSYGLHMFADIIPQFYEDSTQNRVGFFMEATLSVSYHL